MGVARRGVVLEWLVVRDVIAFGLAIRTYGRGPALRLAVEDGRRREPALKPAPGDAFAVEQVAHVGAVHRDDLASRAIVEARLRVADDGAEDRVARDIDVRAVGLAGDQVESARGRGPERGVEAIVAHGKVLRLVPEPSHRVAVELAHHLSRIA